MQNILIGNPAEHLEGKILDGGWTVKEKIPIGRITAGGTGGNFSVAYKVTNAEGRNAFLKAIDYSYAMTSPDISLTLQALTAAYLFECEVLRKCSERRLDRVVMALATGKITLNEPTTVGPAEYIIFELADSDVRGHLQNFSEQFDLAWQLRSLHHIATGLKQLHTNDIVHQDLKPSNVLVFDGKISKLADLGRAAYKGHDIAHDDFPIAGDPAYAPLDHAYGYLLPEWKERRLSCDAYHLGSMAVFFFTGVSMTALTFKHLDAQFRPPFAGGPWTGSFEDVLPYVRAAFEDAVTEFDKHIGDRRLAEDLTRIVRQLCEPDTRLRGHPLDRSPNGNSFSLIRYISAFDLLAKRAENGFYKVIV